MSVNVSHDACLAVVLSTGHASGQDYSDGDRRLLTTLAETARTVGEMPTTLDDAPNHDLRTALRGLRHLQHDCIANGMRSEVVAIMTQWPIPQSTLGWEQRRHVAVAHPGLGVSRHMAFAERSPTWRSAFSRGRGALMSHSR